MTQTVLLGPERDLHRGAHDALFDSPPQGFRYQRPDTRHVFLFRRGCGERPYEFRDWGEFVDFGLGGEPVHSSRWPVFGRRAWITDLDDLLYPVICGRFALHPAARQGGQRPPLPHDEEDIERRRSNMLSAYLHPSCKAMLFWTTHAAQAAFAHFRRLQLPESDLQKLQAKCDVVHVGCRHPVQLQYIRRKWAKPARHVVFCGTEYFQKNGALVLRVFGRVKKAYPGSRLTYIGHVPEDEIAAHRHTLDEIEYYPYLKHEQILSLFESAHILFHPAKFESFGVVFTEAAAAGMAVLSVQGSGMEHTGELFNGGGAVLVRRDNLVCGDEENLLAAALESLLCDTNAARTLGYASYQSAVDGQLSVRRRNRALRQVYDQALSDLNSEQLTPQDLPCRDQASSYVLTDNELADQEAAFIKKHGITQLGIEISV